MGDRRSIDKLLSLASDAQHAGSPADFGGSDSLLVKELSPKPFVIGGEFEVANLYALDAVKRMCLRGEIAAQLRDLPDGTEIELKVVP